MIRIILLATVLGAAAAQAEAESTAGAAFLQINPSAHAYALGQSNALSALGAQALGSNVANLGLISKKFDVATAYAALMDGTAYEHLAAAYGFRDGPLGLDALGVSVTRLQNSGQQGADAQGNLTGSTFGLTDTAVTVGGSALVGSKMRLGLAGKMIQSSIANYTSQPAFAADLGATLTVPGPGRKPMSLGACLTNVGPGVRFIQQTDRLPTAANIGIGVPLGSMLMVFELNRLVNQQETTFGTGLEYALGPVALRGGYLARNNSGNLAAQDQKNGMLLGALAGGVGLRLGPVQFDYAVSEQAVDFGTTQRVTLSIQWGGATSHASQAGQEWRHSDRSDWLIRSMGSY